MSSQVEEKRRTSIAVIAVTTATASIPAELLEQVIADTAPGAASANENFHAAAVAVRDFQKAIEASAKTLYPIQDDAQRNNQIVRQRPE